MNNVNVSLDKIQYQKKPNKAESACINNRISKCGVSLPIDVLANYVGNKGCSFAPAIFNGARKASAVEQVQLLCLDFDNKEKIITFDEAMERSDKLYLPITFAYETFSSQNRNKFRIVFRYFEPIIDEDIIQTIFETKGIELTKIENLLKKPYIDGEIRKRIKYYSRKNSDIKYKKHIAEPNICLPRRVQKMLSRDDIDFNLFEFLNAKATVVNDNYVYYASLKELPKQKIIIMSATIDQKVYAEFFKNRHVKEFFINEVQYKGKIIQNIYNSFSRNWIDNNIEEYEKIRNKYKENGCYDICFKRFEKTDTALHFGETQGKDIYSDSDIVILGTPFPNDMVCKLMAAAMNYDTEIISTDSINIREVSYDKYKFYFPTFKDEFLKNLHIYLISSELEQAVGRGRLLNNDNTVYVFSSFPVKQAIFVND